MYKSVQIILTCECDCGGGAAHLSEAVLGDAGVVAEVGAEDGRDGEAVPLARHAHRRPPLAVRQLHRALVPVHLQCKYNMSWGRGWVSIELPLLKLTFSDSVLFMLRSSYTPFFLALSLIQNRGHSSSQRCFFWLFSTFFR